MKLSHLYKLFGIVLNERFALHPLFTHLFIQSFISMDTWIIISYFIFLPKFLQFWSEVFLCFYDILLFFCFLFLCFSTYLLSSTTRCPKLIFYFLHWSTRISYVSKVPPQCLIPFIREWCQKPRVVGMLIALGISLFLSPLSWLSSKHTKYIHPRISASVCHYLYLYEAPCTLFGVSSPISLPHG